MFPILFGFSFPFVMIFLLSILTLICAHIIAHPQSSPHDRTMTKPTRSRMSRNTAFVSVVTSHNQGFVKKCDDIEVMTDFTENESSQFFYDVVKPSIVNHYACPPTSLELLRRRYGTSDFWGDWSNHETRQFYLQQLPRSLQSKEMRMTYF
jgi:hypothetical protein